jgi:PAS domain S-box-containing protein
MAAEPESPPPAASPASIAALTDEVVRLRRQASDVAALLALPAACSGQEPGRIAQDLADVLSSMLDLAFAYVRLTDPAGGPVIEAAQVEQRPSAADRTEALGRGLAPWITPQPPASAAVIPHPAGSGSVRLVCLPLGTDAMVVAAAARADFPTEAESFLFRTASSQAASALQGARLVGVLRERNRLKDQLLGRELAARLEAERAARRTEGHAIQLRALTRAALAMNGTLSLDELLQVITDQARDIVGAQRAVTRVTLEEDGVERLTAVSPAGMPGPLAETPAPSGVTAPLLGRSGRPLGRIELFGKDGGPFTASDEAVLVQLAQMASMVVERTGLYTEAQAAQRRFHDLVQGLYAIVWEADPATFRFTFVSQRAKEILGYPVEQWLEDPEFWLKHIHAVDRERITTLRRTATAEGREHDFEYRAVTADARMVWLHAIVYVVPGEDGRPRQLRGLMVDVTERRQTEETLRQHAQILDQIHDAVIATDLEGCVTSWNEGAARLFGYPAAEALGRHLSFVYPDNAREFVAEQVLAPLRAKESHEIEVQLQRKTGEEFYGHLSLSVLRDSTGQPVRLIAYAMDVTERRRAEQQLANERTWLEAVLDLAPLPILLIEPGTARVTFANAAADQMAGGDYPKNVPAEEYHTVYYCTDAAGDRIANDQMPGVRVAGGERLEGFQMDWHLPTGARSLLLYADTLPAMHGQPATAVVVFHDITRLKRTEAQLRRANQSKDHFLATLSHELRSPLNAMLGWLHLLRTAKLDEPTRARAFETIERNAKMQAQLIEDLLDVSRVVTGQLRLDVRPVPLRAVIEAALDVVRPAALAKTIRLDVAPDVPDATVSGDPVRLQQVIWNLLSNAVKFTPAGGQVAVHLERAEGQFKLTVRDTGQGITPDFLPHIFERFRQAESPSTRTHGGLGLGLSIVRELIELHGGTVSVESPGEGQGATFTVKLPIPAVRPAEKAGRSVPGVAPILAGVQVLVVDDEADARELVTATLQHYGASVTAVASVGEALEALARLKPDVLLADLALPGEDGYALIGKVRTLPADQGGRTPAAALTAYGTVEDRIRAVSAGFQVHIAKPVQPAELAAVVVTLAARRAA